MPVGLIELLGGAAGNRQRNPLVAGVNTGDLNNLADVVAGVAQGAFQRQWHRMRLAALAKLEDCSKWRSMPTTCGPRENYLQNLLQSTNA
jgi:hypothetical protein